LPNLNVHATFFHGWRQCDGKHPELYQKIVDAGHQVGNHTFNHLGGLKHTYDGMYSYNATEKANALDTLRTSVPSLHMDGCDARPIYMAGQENIK
jgi:hypothetical protein